MGTIVYPPLPDERSMSYSRHYLSQMIFGVTSRPKGFDVNGISWMVENWLLFRRYLRGPGDITSMQFMWKRRHKLRPVPHGRKRSEHLLNSIRQLTQLVNVGETNVDGLYAILDEVQTQMFEFVEDFRGRMEAMNHKDLPKLLIELDRASERAKLHM